jgi:hypothetical protein
MNGRPLSIGEHFVKNFSATFDGEPAFPFKPRFARQAQRTPHPTRLRRPTFSLKGRRVALGGLFGKNTKVCCLLRRSRQYPLLPLREKVAGAKRRSDEGCAEIPFEPGLVGQAQRPPHPPLRGTFSHQGRRGTLGGRFGRNATVGFPPPALAGKRLARAARNTSVAIGAPLSPGGRGDGGEGGSAVQFEPGLVGQAQRPPHPPLRGTFSHQGRRGAGQRFGRNRNTETRISGVAGTVMRISS